MAQTRKQMSRQKLQTILTKLVQRHVALCKVFSIKSLTNHIRTYYPQYEIKYDDVDVLTHDILHMTPEVVARRLLCVGQSLRWFDMEQDTDVLFKVDCRQRFCIPAYLIKKMSMFLNSISQQYDDLSQLMLARLHYGEASFVICTSQEVLNNLREQNICQDYLTVARQFMVDKDYNIRFKNTWFANQVQLPTMVRMALNTSHTAIIIQPHYRMKDVPAVEIDGGVMRLIHTSLLRPNSAVVSTSQGPKTISLG